MSGFDRLLLVGEIFLVLLFLAACVVTSRFFSLWLQACVSGTRISLPSLVLMTLRGVDAREIVKCKVMSVQAGLTNHSTRGMESHLLAGGNIERVTQALVVAHRARIQLDWDTAAAVDLAGRDILAAVQTSVTPRVIDCPANTEQVQSTIDGVARDGIQLKVRVRVTVRTNLGQLIGGATEATIIARVGQGIVSSIGSCATYRDALANPKLIAEEVIRKGLDAQTAFEIVSVDIADIDVGSNVGARLQIAQATADMRIAQAEAEKRRAMALARNTEMKALVQENWAAVALADAAVPVAVAQAFRKGSFRIRSRHQQVSMSTFRPRGLITSIPGQLSQAE